MTPEHTPPTQTPGADDPGPTVLRADPQAAYGIPPGTLLVNTYRVERLLGGGGMGEVYLARHAGIGTEHAIKVIRPSMAMNAQVMELFYREARVLRGVRHDAVVSYDGFVRDDQGRDYLVMEYVEGQSLSERLKRGPMSASDVLALRDRLCAGLAEAHRKGAVHRDLSPDNVILPGDRIETAKLIDFGLCKLMDPGQETIVGSSFAGKYRYASPEQFGLYGGAVDARSDIYSLGLILAAAAQGSPLDMGESFEAALRSRQQVPDLTQVPPILRDWLTAMLQPDPAARPASIGALLDGWPAATVLAGKCPASATAVRTPGPGPKARARSGQARGRRWALPVAGLVLAAGLGAGIWWALKPLETSKPPADRPGAGVPIEPGMPRDASPSELEPAREPDGSPPPKPDLHPERQPDRPAIPAADDLDGLLAAGRLDDAFALVESRIAAGQAPPADRTWSLAQRLRAAGKTDPAFALTRSLAKGDYGPAAFALAELYDPLHWSASGSPFSKPNAEKARDWYRRAAGLGVAGAQARLEALQSLGEAQ